MMRYQQCGCDDVGYFPSELIHVVALTIGIYKSPATLQITQMQNVVVKSDILHNDVACMLDHACQDLKCNCTHH